MLLRGPAFPGRHRFEAAFRSLLTPPADQVATGIKMELDPQEWLQIHLLTGQAHEPRTMNLIETILRPGDVHVDVGAHVGFHTLVAARCVGQGGRVIAIDPQPYNCDRILTNAEINGFSNILVVMAAAGADDGFCLLHNQKRNDKSRLSLSGAGVGDTNLQFEVPIVRLDSVLSRHGVERVTLLKIDVEGYEQQVLDGAKESLSRTQHIIFELLPQTEDKVAEDICRTLMQLKFALWQVDGSPWILGMPLIENNVWATKA